MASRSNLVLVLLLVLPVYADPVEQGTRGWQQLQDGQLTAATRTFESMLTTNADPLAQAGDVMARRWLTRLDREKVKAALLAAYAGKIEYPATLTGLQPAADRWDQPWVYELTKTKYIPGIAKQTYRLESRTLGAMSDLAGALWVPYGSRIILQPVSVASGAVTFSQPGRSQPVVLSVGTSFDGITLAGQTDTTLILSDGDHWRLVPVPKK